MANNSFTDIFTGNPVWSANASYVSYNITGSISLNWPTQFLDNPNLIGNFTSISANNNGYTVTLPTAKDASVGQSIIFTNASVSNFSFTVNDNAGGFLVTITQGKAYLLLLTDNTTDAGSWLIYPFAQGTTAVTSVAATTSSGGLTIGGSPITSSGTLTFTLASSLNALAALNSTGIIVQTGSGPSVMTTRSIIGGTNIDVANGDGIAGAPTVNLSDTLANLSSVMVGSLTLSNNIIATTAGNTNIQLSPNGTGSILLGSGLTPPTVSPAGNITATSAVFGNIQVAGNSIQPISGALNLTCSASNAFLNAPTGNVSLQSGASAPFTINSSGIISHPSVLKNLVYFNGSTAAILYNWNITSVTRNSTGNYTIVWSVPFGSANYTVSPMAVDSGGVGIVSNVISQSNTQIVLQTKTIAGSVIDPSFISVQAAG